ncbi:heme exporter protein B [Catalinimonas alkaloidigena]|uniref:Heme exporter protein B n=1 Tax=Catalinimonas alkaloidigena TaxID=1075417 RepID=A0A1G9F2C5_9BACT|nr:heme exporter protein CcmB [Catalinimonas alkaloidigena]SDK82586.1 heme exporter protein B [Catalinimonas alkaloidigena]
MALLHEIRTLVRKEILLEWRQRYALNGMLLYVVSTVWIVYLSFQLAGGQIGVVTWNALFWITLLFTSVNAIAKSFMQESRGRQLYYYLLTSPEGLILAKIVYNVVLMLTLTLVGLVVYGWVLGTPIQDWPLFLLATLLGAVGFAGTLTMVSGIAAKAGNNTTLMAILSFPIILPMLLMLMRVSKNALDGLDWAASRDELGVLLAMNMIVVTLSYFLFPYLWRS